MASTRSTSYPSARRAGPGIRVRSAMLTTDVRFEGWTTEDWVRFLHLWKPRASPDVEATRPRGGLFVIHDSARIQKLLHTKRGRLEAGGPWPVPLSELAREHGASWAI